jgi:hypothetical protein
LYYARAVDPTVLMYLNDLATEKTKATEKTQAATDQLLDYLPTHPDATIRHHASYMILHIHSDDSYLSVSNAPSRLGDLLFCGDKWLHPQCDISHQKYGRLSGRIRSRSVLSKLTKWSTSKSWATFNLQLFSAQITQRHLAS